MVSCSQQQQQLHVSLTDFLHMWNQPRTKHGAMLCSSGSSCLAGMLPELSRLVLWGSMHVHRIMLVLQSVLGRSLSASNECACMVAGASQPPIGQGGPASGRNAPHVQSVCRADLRQEP